MPVPHLLLSTTSSDVAADVLAIAVVTAPAGAVIARTEGVNGTDAEALDATIRAIGFRGSRDEVRRIPAPFGASSSIALVGLGTATPDADSLRYAAGSATRQLSGISSIVLDFPVATSADITATLEGAAIGAYRFTTYRSGPSRDSSQGGGTAPADSGPSTLTTVTVASHGVELSGTEAATAIASANAMATVRDLVNTPANDLYPQTFAERAITVTEQLPIEVTVLDDNDLRREGFGGIVGVGQGSERGPRLVTARWNPPGATRHLALVGKGITFDSGGLSLKPPTSMVGMKYDMTGAATALAVIRAVAELELPVRVTAWMCLAENMPSGTATRPGDVMTMKNGRTVEVLNTDAEGRLVLADGLVAASAEHPDAIVDIATLTGAASVAMGNRYVAAMGDADFVGRVVSAAGRAGEPMWHMPLPGELRAMLDSDIADLTNVKIGNTAGGMLIAGIFLKEFVGRTADGSALIPWAHLDIAGAANNALGGYGFTGKGPTAVAVRALIEVAREISRG